MAVVTIAAVIGAYRLGLARGFEHTIGMEAWGRIAFAIGAAVTDMAHGGKGYVIYEVIETVLRYGGLSGDPTVLAYLGLTYPDNLQNGPLIDAAIAKAVHFPNPISPVRGASGDDLGMIDFVKLSFTLFGYHFLALYLTYFMLFAGSIWSFLRTFRSRPAYLALLTLAALAHLGLFASSLLDLTGDTLGSPTNPRFLSVLAIIPSLHLALAMWTRLPATRQNLVFVAFQAAVVVFACWIRASAIWAPTSLLLLALSVGLRTRSFRPLWSFGLLAALWLLHGLYVAQVLNPVYRVAGDDTHHVVWHAIFSSLLFNPHWKEKYAAVYDNAAGDELTPVVAAKYLARHPSADSAALINPSSGTLKWSAIEAAVRSAFFELLADDPKFVLSTFLFYKPLYLCQGLGTHVASLRRLPSVWLWIITGAGLTMISFFAVYDTERRAFITATVLVTGGLLVSLAPVLLTVPFQNLIGDQLLMLVTTGAAWSVALPAFAISRALQWLRNPVGALPALAHSDTPHDGEG